ncbi:MAG: hypothetical protein OEU94_04375 [Aquincola sp.]|nr:hypothetical protein [Aquincola sp.]MDH5328716.1 hypothetical protein [Aquincola sp.]
MSLSHSTLPRSVNLVHVRAPRDLERVDPALRESLPRLAALDDPTAIGAAVLALLVTADSPSEREAWDDVARDLALAGRLFGDLAALPRPRRLPWFEHLARRLAPEPVPVRHAVIDCARRIMTADGVVSPLDQLRWVALRHLMAGSAVAPPAAAHTDLETMDDAIAHQVCAYSAFLSQLVPAPEVTLELAEFESVTQSWYDSVTAPWQGRLALPVREVQDIDAALRALRVLQGMPWLLRPVLVRTWFDAARVLTDGPALHADAADALRLSCVLLDSPVPPELGRQYIEVDAARQ